jgi:hypothetical protein
LTVVATNVAGAVVIAGAATVTAASVDAEPAELADVEPAEPAPADVAPGELEVESLGSLLAAQPARPAAAAQLKNVRRDREDTPTVKHAYRAELRRAKPKAN